MTDVLVVGGGLAGLGVASFLHRAGLEVQVHEEGDQPGGKVQTVQEDGYVVELGPLGWLDKEAAVHDFVAGLGLDPLPAADAQKERLLLKQGKLHVLPSGPGSFMTTPVLPMRSKLRLFCEPFIKARREGEESIHDFATRRFGSGVAETFFGAMVSGIFGGDARRLSVHAAFPLMAGWEFESGSCVRGALKHMKRKKQLKKSGALPPTTGNLCSLPEGMAGLTDAAAASLGAGYHGSSAIDRVVRVDDDWILECDGQEVARAPQVVFATPTHVTARLLQDAVPTLQPAANGIRGASLHVVTAGFDRDQVEDPLHGFGFLALREQGFRPLGVQYASTIFPDQSPKGKVQLRVLIGGTYDPEAADLSDDALQAACLDPLKPLLGVKGEPEKVWMRRVMGGIPQYTMGHLDRVATFDRAESEQPGLHFAGDSLHGVGVNAVLKRARAVADKVARIPDRE